MSNVEEQIEQAEAEAVFKRYLSDPDKFVYVERPEADGKVRKARMRALSRSETQQCLAAAVRRFREMELPYDSALFHDHFEDELLNQMLHFSLRDERNPQVTFAEDADNLRDFLTPREQSKIFDVYERHFGDVRPDPELLSPGQLAEIRNAIKKKDSAVLRRFAWVELASYLLTLDEPPSN